ncbi:MAG: dihydroorotate dehydrogenase [Candidatus Aminicenantes bacterium]|nr:dihydroorotate dehydrogenase [Candidatus Aminicenantes bacterium]
MADLRADLGFLQLRNPVLTASGTFGYGMEFLSFLDLSAIGGIVVKGLYYGPREGNPPPRLVETASGLINAIGLPGVGVEHFAADVLPELRKHDATVIVNVCGDGDEEYFQVIEFLNRYDGIAAYELNISCPNVKLNGACPAMNPHMTRTIVATAKQRSRRPLVVKLSPNVTNIAEIARAAEDGGADGISLINTLLAMAVDLETRRPKLGNVFGGLSGPAIKPVALRMTYQVAQAVRIPIIGMGGICTGRDALEFMLVGARAVQVGTANFVDPAASVRIVHEIAEYCDARGIARVADIVGTLETNR